MKSLLKSTMSIIVITVALQAQDNNASVSKEADKFNAEIAQTVDQEITNMKAMIMEMKQAKEAGVYEQKQEKEDKTILPLMQGSYKITVDGEVKSQKALVEDSGGGSMYLSTTNNMAVKQIKSDYIEYKTDSSTVKSAMVVNGSTQNVGSKKEVKATFNSFSSKSKKPVIKNNPSQIPQSFDELVNNLEKTAPKGK